MRSYLLIRNDDVPGIGLADVQLLLVGADSQRRMVLWMASRGARFTLSSVSKLMRRKTGELIAAGGIPAVTAREIVDASGKVGRSGVRPMLLALGQVTISRVKSAEWLDVDTIVQCAAARDRVWVYNLLQSA